jgi:hypothetical protein
VPDLCACPDGARFIDIRRFVHEIAGLIAAHRLLGLHIKDQVLEDRAPLREVVSPAF